MAVEVVTAIQIGRPRTEVAEFACNPDNATRWYANIKSVEWMSPPPLTVGSRLSFVASFLVRQLAYTYEVVELVPGSKLTMSTQQGPFPMETSYTWEDTTPRGTRMTLRNRGEPTGFSKVGGPLLTLAMRRANQRDLARLKRELESASGAMDSQPT
jgi:hypothetical protein